ncbi:LOW QUALITY PROTEIN: aldehyde oxidase 2-like [Morus bassanus]
MLPTQRNWTMLLGSGRMCVFIFYRRSGLKKNCHDAYHPIILHPVRIPEMQVVSSTNDGLVIGAACCLAELRDILMKAIPKLPEKKTKTHQALLQHLRTLAGEQIGSMASLGHIVSRRSTWDLNPVLPVGKSVLNLASEDGKRQILLNDQFLAGCEHADKKLKEVIFSVLIPYSMEVRPRCFRGFIQAERQKNALSIVNSGMVLFSPATDTIVDLSILYGGIGSTTLGARKSCEKLIRQWNDQMLNEACSLVLEEILLPPSALGRKVKYRITLLVSSLFRFYLEVLHCLHQMYPFKYAELSQENMSALGMLKSGVPQGVHYQDVDPGQSPQDPVGCPIMHQSGIKHATGEAIYIDDIRPVDGELSLAMVTGIKVHAKIISVDASEALVPGVVDVVTARDVPGENGKDEQAYAEDKVICVGQIIYAVIAESLTQAKCSTEKVKIVYEGLEPILMTEDAIEHNSYFTEERKIEKGDIEKGFKSADEIIEGELHMGGQEYFYLETNNVLVIPRVEDKEMGVYVSTQHATDVQELVASALNLSNKITCHVKHGGAFHGKITKPSLFAVIAAVAANKLLADIDNSGIINIRI